MPQGPTRHVPREVAPSQQELDSILGPIDTENQIVSEMYRARPSSLTQIRTAAEHIAKIQTQSQEVHGRES